MQALHHNACVAKLRPMLQRLLALEQHGIALLARAPEQATASGAGGTSRPAADAEVANPCAECKLKSSMTRLYLCLEHLLLHICQVLSFQIYASIKFYIVGRWRPTV